jgi:hypothetical protein
VIKLLKRITQIFGIKRVKSMQVIDYSLLAGTKSKKTGPNLEKRKVYYAKNATLSFDGQEIKVLKTTKTKHLIQIGETK